MNLNKPEWLVALVIILLVATTAIAFGIRQWNLQKRIESVREEPEIYPPMITDVRPRPNTVVDSTYWEESGRASVGDICVYINVDDFPQFQKEADFQRELRVDLRKVVERSSSEVMLDTFVERIICWHDDLSHGSHIVDLKLSLNSTQEEYTYSWVFEFSD